MNAPAAINPMLPGVLAEIAEVAGEDAALAIARVRGGTEIYVPAVPANDHWLCRLIGRDEAKAVCERLTGGIGIGTRVTLPQGPNGFQARMRAKVDAMLRDERSYRDIAIETGYTKRAIARRHAKLGIERVDPQLPLL